MEQTNQTNPSNSSNNSIIIAIVLSTLAIIGSMFYFSTQGAAVGNSNSVENKISQKLEDLEAQKVGGKENYELLKKLYSSKGFKDQQKQYFENAMKQFGVDNTTTTDTSANNGNNNQNTGSNTTTTSSLDPNFKEGTIEKSKLDDILKASYINGDKNSKIVWLEYSDTQCPFCKRFHQAGTISAVMDKYKGQIAYSMQHYPLPFHPYAQTGSLALECVGELAGNEKFFEYQNKVFASSEDPTVDNLMNIAKSMKIDTKKLTTCINSGKYEGKISTQTNEGQSLFSVQGTPGNVLINTSTGKWVLVPGAYPTSEIEKVITYLNK